MGHFGGVQFDFTVLEDAHFGARGIPQGRTEAVLEGWAARTGRRHPARLGVRRARRRLPGRRRTSRSPSVRPTATRSGCAPRTWWAATAGQPRSARRPASTSPAPTPPRACTWPTSPAARLRPRFLGERLPERHGDGGPARRGRGPDHRLPRRHRRRTTASETVTFEEVAEAWQRHHRRGHPRRRRRLGSAPSPTPPARSPSTGAGRVLLAGDAAHIHLPAGGQGLSTGVQDAVNLGWKLAAVVRGGAPAALLDTYHAERQPVGAPAAGQHPRPGDGLPRRRGVGPAARAVRRAGRVRRRSSGTWPERSATSTSATTSAPARTPTRWSAAGCRRGCWSAPTASSAPPRLLHPGRAVLLDFADDAGLRAVRQPAGRAASTCHTVSAKPVDGPDVLAGVPALLLRPDGYVAWAGEPAQGLAAALERWLGAASA